MALSSLPPLRALLVFAILAPAVCAQLQFAEAVKRHLPADEDLSRALALADVDGDGDADLVVGNGWVTRQQQNRLYLNDGGRFSDVTASQMPALLDYTSALVSGDVDGDGDLDLVFANSGQNRLYINDGSGTFVDDTATRLPTDSDDSAAIALGDVDGDGDADLVIGNPEQNRLYLNDGSGLFSDATSAGLPNGGASALALGDVDGDGDLDLAIGHSDGPPFYGSSQTRLYLNNGAGTYSDATAGRMPIDTATSTGAVTFGDVDGDGDLDLLLGNNFGVPYGGFNPRNGLYLNDGHGTFTNASAGRLPDDSDETWDIAVGDVDGDGDVDLIYANDHWQQFQNRLYLNDGNGFFTDATDGRITIDSDPTRAVVLGDVDTDGDLDVVFGNSADRNRLGLNDGSGVFAEANGARLSNYNDPTTAVALGDVDGDGDADVIFGNSRAQNRLNLNDGRGGFTDATAGRMPFDRNAAAAVVLADVDADGDADLIWALNSGQNRLYLNDGSGTFVDATAGRMPNYNDYTNDMALGDVDGDGDPDLVFSNFPTQSRLYLNDGSGTFTDATTGRLPTGGDRSTAFGLADVDGDGDLDLVVARVGLTSSPRSNVLYLNDGNGSFAVAPAGRMPVDSDDTLATAVGDVDGDGDVDLVFANDGQNRLYANDGSGTFTDVTASQFPALAGTSVAVTLGDVDEDGDADLVFCNSDGLDRLYVNDGGGTFVDASPARASLSNELSTAVALGDVDGDGDPDLVFACRTRDRIYVNLLRHLEVPFLVTPGRPYQLDAYARYGPPRPVDVAAPFLATGTAQIPLPPFGVFGLDPAQMVVFPAGVIPQPAGVRTLSFRVPNLPSLVGVSLYSQALVVQTPVSERLTNVTADQIVR